MSGRLSRIAGALAARLVMAAALSGCTSPVSPPSYAPFSQADLREGTGTAINDGLTLHVLYTGWFYDATQPDQKGAVFDATGEETFDFQLGNAEVIEGWEQGLRGMKAGGLRRLVVPPSLAYGGTRSGPIPPNATLLFEVELVSFE